MRERDTRQDTGTRYAGTVKNVTTDSSWDAFTPDTAAFFRVLHRTSAAPETTENATTDEQGS